jgi:hypothetical protein
MMQGLVHAPNVFRSQARSHRLDALALSRQQQTRTVVLQWNCSIGMPCGLRQAFHICPKALLLWAWRGEA